MNSFLTFFHQQTIMMSAAEVAALQDDLYDLQMAAGSNPVLQEKITQILDRLDTFVERVEEVDDTTDTHLIELPTLMAQAQRQCQQ